MNSTAWAMNMCTEDGGGGEASGTFVNARADRLAFDAHGEGVVTDEAGFGVDAGFHVLDALLVPLQLPLPLPLHQQALCHELPPRGLHLLGRRRSRPLRHFSRQPQPHPHSNPKPLRCPLSAYIDPKATAPQLDCISWHKQTPHIIDLKLQSLCRINAEEGS